MIANDFTHKPYLVKLTNPNFLNYAGADTTFKMQSSGGDGFMRKIIRPMMLPALRFVRKRMIKKAARVLAISPQIVERLEECGFANVIDIPNGIDTDKFMPASAEYKLELRHKLGLSENAVIFIYTGRFAVEKNLITLLKAWHVLMAEYPKQDLNLIILGDSNGQIYSSEKELKTYTRKNNLAGLSFKGSVFNVDEYLQASDVFVLPSLWEGMSNALLEAMAVGLPAVVSNIPANRALVADRRSGLMFPVENHKALADCMKLMIEYPDQRQAMGKRGREIAESGYSIQAVSTRLLHEYSEIVSEFG
jgi:glycosyltransferase involved in cell wall biosynthesis